MQHDKNAVDSGDAGVAETEKERQWFSWAPYALPAAVIGAGIVVGAYILNFWGFGFSSAQSDWGTFGDYVGGTLNPFLSFLAFVALIFTLRVQVEQAKYARLQMEDSRSERDASREQLRRTVEAQERTAHMLFRQAQQADYSARVATLNNAYSILATILTNMAPLLGKPGAHLLLRRYSDVDRLCGQIQDEIVSLAKEVMENRTTVASGDSTNT